MPRLLVEKISQLMELKSKMLFFRELFHFRELKLKTFSNFAAQYWPVA